MSTASLSPPRYLFLSINETCDLHCGHCDYWRTPSELPERMSCTRRAQVIEEFAELAPGASVVICGGEPMLDLVAYYETCRVSRLLGLRTLSVVNGVQIASAEDAERVVRHGPDEISVSLDGPSAEIHDASRGTRGAYRKATGAISLLLDARKKTGSQIKIYVMGMLCHTTAPYLDSFYALVLDALGADKLKLNDLQPSFLNTRLEQFRARDDYFARESQVDPDELRAMLGRCERLFDLYYNPAWVEQVVAYFAGLWKRDRLYLGWRGGLETREVICDTALRNVMVDVRGRASLCFGTQFPSWSLRWPGDLRRVWEELGAETRSKMSRCRALCGISHSVRREHATLPSEWSSGLDEQLLGRISRESRRGRP